MSIIERYAFEKLFKTEHVDNPPQMLWGGEINAIIALLKAFDCKTFVEFGVNHGHTASCILKYCKNITKYIGIDVLPGTRLINECQNNEVPGENIAGYMAKEDPRFELILRPRGTFDLTRNDFNSVDAIFIDGDHSEEAVRYDTKLARELNPKLILFHDFDNPNINYSACGPKIVIDELNKKEGDHICLLEGTMLCFELRQSILNT